MSIRQNATEYVKKYKTISSYVDFKIPKRLTPSDKGRITRYYNQISRLKTRGFTVAKSSSPKRIAKANALAKSTKGFPGIKVAFVQTGPVGSKVRITAQGFPQWEIDGVKRVLIPAEFFPTDFEGIATDDDGEELDESVIDDEAQRILEAAAEALGRKPQKVAVAYYGGDGDTNDATLNLTRELLKFDSGKYERKDKYGDVTPGRTSLRLGIAAYVFPSSKRIARQIDKVHDEISEASAKARARWRGHK